MTPAAPPIRCGIALLACAVAGGVQAAGGSFERTTDGVIVTPAAGPAAKVRLQFTSDRIIHVTAVPQASLDLPASLMVVAPPPAHPNYQITRQGDRLVLKSARVSAEVSLATGLVSFRNAHGIRVLEERDRGVFEPVTVGEQPFYSLRQQFNPGTDEAFYGLGQHQNAQMNYNGEDVLLAQHNMDVAIPFVVSSRNYGLLWDNNSITRFGDPRPYGLASRDLKLYDADGKPGGLTARYYVNGQLRLTRTEADINYQYIKDLQNRPAELLGEGSSSTSAQHVDVAGETVVWEGRLEASVSGVHKFQLYASSYFKLYIDGKLLLDRWRQNWNPWYHNVEVPLTVGKSIAIRVEWTPNDGYIALLHNNPLPEPDRHSLSLASELGHAIDYYFVSGGSLDEVIAGYRELTGKAVMMPRWAYGFWQSRQRYKTQDEVLAVGKAYRERGLPLDNVVEDWFYWREDDWGSHKFDPARFPDPKGMIEQLHAQNLHFMISVWPKFYPTTDNYKELDAKGHIYHRNVELGIHDWVGKGYLNSDYDPYSTEARAIYWRQIHDNLDVLGVDAWWLDATEPDIHSNVDVEENKLRIGPTALGPGAAFYNSFPLMQTKAVYEGSRASDPDRRAFILTRSAFAGQQRNAAATWSGDTASRWTDLYNQISAGVNFSMSGIPNWSFDIGGFTMENRYHNPSPADLDEWRELNLRWFQFGAFVPLFRSHGEEPFREIYSLAPEGSEVYNSLAFYDRLRYRLMPYIYTLGADAALRDGTIMRGLVMDFPHDVRVRNLSDEYLFGPSFLVSPVYEYQARTRKVYLPAGTEWTDFYTGKTYTGGQQIEAAAPLARMPLFVRAGAIIPVGPVIEYTGQKPDAPITLCVFTGRDGAFDLYEDDGVSYGYERGELARIPMKYHEAAGTLTIGARQGAFPGMVAHRTFKVRWMAPGAAAPTDFDAAADLSIDYSGAALTVHRAVAHPALWPKTHSRGLVDPETEQRVTELMAGMSLEDKVGQMIQADLTTVRPEDLMEYPLGSILAGGNSPPLGAPDRAPASAWIDTARAFRAASLAARSGHVPIPVMFGIDAVHGNSNVVGATIFPHNIGLGAMHDRALVRRIGAATAEETAATGIDWAFGPTLAAPQDDRWGRSYEGYSESPALVRSYGGEMVRGLQGEPGARRMLQNGHVAASAKHFLGDGGTTDGIDQGDTDVSERELIGTHAQGYLSAIPAGVVGVLVSYSSWQGRKMHGNDSLLTGVLKGQLGFDGFVVSDWNGHGQVPGCSSADCPAAINAGLDMFMAPDKWKELYHATLAEAGAGVIPLTRIDDAVRRILRVKFKLGLFEAGRPWEGRGDVLGNPAHRALARQAVRESLVLLKNNGGVLPLRAGAHVLVAGEAADDISRQTGGWTLSWQGTGNTNSDFPNGQSIYAGLRAALAAGGGSAELSVDGRFRNKPDAAIVVFGETPYAEMMGDLHTLEFEPGDKPGLALLRRLRAAGVPVVAVFLSGRPLWVNAEINAADAFVAAWLPGSEGGGVADLLIGDAAGKPRHDFTGRLSFSWPRNARQYHLNYGKRP
ncbi:MAG TPA: TIM-barrel domain-containing protein, partial [Steroidobacteraceae bacterium]|nr:TIM-barrel domain-containing protein [Steroidobacteraceae bacterium]